MEINLDIKGQLIKKLEHMGLSVGGSGTSLMGMKVKNIGHVDNPQVEQMDFDISLVFDAKSQNKVASVGLVFAVKNFELFLLESNMYKKSYYDEEYANSHDYKCVQLNKKISNKEDFKAVMEDVIQHKKLFNKEEVVATHKKNKKHKI